MPATAQAARRAAALSLAWALLSACSRHDAVADLPDGRWRATLALPGGELPFAFDVAQQDGRPIAWLLNGPDRERVDEIYPAGDAIVMRMPGFENRIEAKLGGQRDELQGTLVMIKSGAKEQRIPFAARRGVNWRFFPPEGTATTAPDTTAAAATAAATTSAAGAGGAATAPAADIGGRWAVTFDDAGKLAPAVGEFTQQGTRVTGTFLTPTGDHRYLEGELRDGELYLSKFDGGHVFLYRAKLADDGALAGTYWSGLWHSETFVAHRDAGANLGEAERATRMRAGEQRLDFRFPDLGGIYVSPSDPFYRGKVVIVALAGSWCPNCHDEAAFLAPLYRRLRRRGLEVISLQFEQFGDFERAVEATHRFRERYRIDYQTLIAGISEKDDAAAKLPQLNGVFAFPTTILIDRRGTVRHIHTGFSGPATGEHYLRLTRDLEERIGALLAEPAPAPLPLPSLAPAPAPPPAPPATPTRDAAPLPAAATARG
ncbi:MAG: TlpA disulfide reductase family protein [Steroidobacteraceae bacterium]